ncbi:MULTISPECIES: hypothetical protein [unclassified Janthinobacterium]|uniref:hypothetical protein n=1 Tax=unclassified Janthinobacterium TaxID=2610881 RepID=UPI00160DA16D|nr:MULTISPECIES: hypothetical protein [unclassified Janthinobacterium]MBB5371072.1 hypothetical protein [Janthinobacterium sp. K2C7]MBB5383878.1 hypothetical protein [Janthinobacterium sp. K2Li3]MBB5389300.1 hypothetical protein [Janthinobacterium sp. K2E3]
MTNKKPIIRKTASAHQPTELDGARLSNMAQQPEPSDVHDDASLQAIIELITKLSPSNVDLVTKIIRAIVDQLTPEN